MSATKFGQPALCLFLVAGTFSPPCGGRKRAGAAFRAVDVVSFSAGSGDHSRRGAVAATARKFLAQRTGSCGRLESFRGGCRVVALGRGSVALVPFPFSDLSQAKLRPAIVLASVGGGGAVDARCLRTNSHGRCRGLRLIVSTTCPVRGSDHDGRPRLRQVSGWHLFSQRPEIRPSSHCIRGSSMSKTVCHSCLIHSRSRASRLAETSDSISVWS